MGNKVGNRRDKAMAAEAIPFEDSLKCHSLGVVMTRALMAVWRVWCFCVWGGAVFYYIDRCMYT